MQVVEGPFSEPPTPHQLAADAAPWRRYVTRLCTDAWHLKPSATQDVLRKIDALVRARVLTEPAVVLVLEGAGVTAAEAEHIAPSIRVAARA